VPDVASSKNRRSGCTISFNIYKNKANNKKKNNRSEKPKKTTQKKTHTKIQKRPKEKSNEGQKKSSRRESGQGKDFSSPIRAVGHLLRLGTRQEEGLRRRELHRRPFPAGGTAIFSNFTCKDSRPIVRKKQRETTQACRRTRLFAQTT